ncbi:hypothetical protein [Streptomyces sp. NPDC058308]|uniref:hypothetical protein n=1 Tax=Streptomyces sp. NPDC058308 TaxID=3346440 RepID=UPI0036F014A5
MLTPTTATAQAPAPQAPAAPSASSTPPQPQAPPRSSRPRRRANRRTSPRFPSGPRSSSRTLAPKPPTTAPAPSRPPPQQPAPAPPPAAEAPEGDVARLPKWAQQALADSGAAARRAAVQTAVIQAATGTGADVARLLDSASFTAAVAQLDPSDTAAVADAIKNAVTAQPYLAAVPHRFGLPVAAITGDGTLGYFDRAPYDRVISTVGLRAQVPWAWVEQTQPGIIVTPWGTGSATATPSPAWSSPRTAAPPPDGSQGPPSS